MPSLPQHASTWLSALACLLTLLSCTSGGVVGTSEADAYDECGNGMDDDADGLIDEGCPCGEGESQTCFGGIYPNRLVGACRDGAQVCDVQGGIEFGRWARCLGDTLPLVELCGEVNGDGSVDDDCDGSIDEGCDCEDGQARECGLEFSMLPCQSGTQRCLENSVWSHCEGAIGPSAELCSDDLDNDCDGLVNEGCDCTPSPEMCGDGIDNDCDGTTDEGCEACVPSAEVCGNGLDDDCDDAIDEDCSCTPSCAASELVWDRQIAPLSLDLATFDASRSMWSGEGYTFLFGATARTDDGCGGAYTVHYGLDGAADPALCVADADIDGAAEVVRMGEELLTVSRDGTGYRMQPMTLRGVPTGPSVMGEGAVQAVAASEREIGAIIRLPDEPFSLFYRFNFDLEAIGVPFALSTQETLGAPDRSVSIRALAPAGGRWVAAGLISEPSDTILPMPLTVRAWTLGDTSVEARRDLSAVDLAGQISIGGSHRGALVCWMESRAVVFGTRSELHCRRFDGLGIGAGESFLVGTEAGFTQTSDTLVVDWNCRWLVITAGADGTRPDGFGLQDASLIVWIDDQGEVEPIPRPPELENSSVTYHWYFSPSFGNNSAGPAGSPFMLRGRGANAGSNYPHSRVMLSCP